MPSRFRLALAALAAAAGLAAAAAPAVAVSAAPAVAASAVSHQGTQPRDTWT